MSALKIVLLPGMDGEGSYLTPLKELLAREYDCSILSYPQNPMSMDELCHWVCDKLDAGSDYLIVAESFGGPVAIKTAAMDSRVKGLVLSATFCKPPLLPTLLSMLGNTYPLVVRQLWFSTFLVNWSMWNGNNPELAGRIQRILAETPNETIQNRIRILSRLDVMQDAGKLTVPVLVLKPNQDNIARLGHFVLPGNWPVERIDGPHELLGTCAEICSKAIFKFIDRL